MARIRSIKPGFFSNEELCELSPWHRLCFAGLWTQADREGRLEDRPRRLKAAIFPYDDVDMNQLLDGLSGKGFVIRYAADGVAYLAIPTFLEHQRPKTDETLSVIPPPLLSDPRGKASPPRSYKGQMDLGSGNRTEGIRADVAPLTADGADDFMDLWNQTTTSPLAHCRDLSSKRRRHVRARLTELPLTEWRSVFERIERSAFCRGKNDRDWIASFDWVIGSPDVALKVLEGKYDDRRSQPQESFEAQAYRAWMTSGGCSHSPRCGNYTTCQVVSMRKAKAS